MNPDLKTKFRLVKPEDIATLGRLVPTLLDTPVEELIERRYRLLHELGVWFYTRQDMGEPASEYAALGSLGAGPLRNQILNIDCAIYVLDPTKSDPSAWLPEDRMDCYNRIPFASGYVIELTNDLGQLSYFMPPEFGTDLASAAYKWQKFEDAKAWLDNTDFGYPARIMYAAYTY